MNCKYFTLLFLIFGAFSLSAQRSINTITKETSKCLVTPIEKSTSNEKSHLMKIETKKNQPIVRGASKLALVEEFTNASCGPCAAQNPAFNTLIDGNEGSVVAVKYQVWFPGYDPMYETNKTEVQARWSIYEDYTIGLYGEDNGLGGVPTAFLDGYMGNGTYGGGNWNQAYYGAPVGYNQASFNYAANQSTPLNIKVNHSYSTGLDSVLITVVVTNNSDSVYELSGYNLHTSILESRLNWPVAPGTNGEKEFSHIFRKSASDIYGDNVLPASFDAGESFTYTYGVPVNNYVFALNQIEVLAFIQNTTNLSVMNAALSSPTTFPDGVIVGDPALSNNSRSQSGICPDNYTAEPIARVTNLNPDQSAITEVTLAYSINGQEAQKSFAADIAYGKTQEFNFGEVNVSGGTNSIDVWLVSFNNGALDVNLINNLTESYSFTYLSEHGTVPPKVYDMEGDDVLGTGLFMDDPNFDYIFTMTPELTNPPANRGAYGKSKNSLLFYFFQWNPASTSASMSFVSDKINMPSNPIYSYDWAYAGYIESGVKYDGDKVEMFYSTDCGATYKKFNILSGNAMKTGGDKTAFFFPTASEWRSDTISIPDLANTDDVIFKTTVTSNWGNAGYLDNIFIGQGATSSSKNINSFENVSIFPNPAADQLNVRINAKVPSTATVSILDYTGKTVQTLNNNLAVFNGSNNLSFDVSTLSNGMYLLKIENKEGVNIQRFTVVK